jgi:hypothetical protein
LSQYTLAQGEVTMSRPLNRRSFLATTAGLSAVLFCGKARANTTDIIRIEQDWRLVGGDPEPDVDAPQIITIFGPRNPLTGLHAVYEINHSTMPDYSEGGMQLQVWSGNTLVGYKSQFAPAELNVTDEVITYTTGVEVQTDGRVRMEVINGVSATWGDFDGDRALRLRVASDIENLNDWDPLDSIKNSRIGYGANRIVMFKRTEIRYYNQGGLDHTTTEDTVVEAWDS